MSSWVPPGPHNFLCTCLCILYICHRPSIKYLLQELGADVVIDYTQKSLLGTCKGARFDGVIDCVGGKAESESYACLHQRGTFVEILNPGMSIPTLISHLLRSMVGLGPRQVQISIFISLFFYLNFFFFNIIS